MSKVSFRPVRGTESVINNMAIQDGYIYYAVDSGKIYLDKDDQRIGMGGSGAAIYYGKGDNLNSNEDDGTIYFPIESLEDSSIVPKINDIILNHDGAFYRVIAANKDILDCVLLSVSGTGSGGNTGFRQTQPTIKVESPNTTLINGSDVQVYFTVTSDIDSDNEIIDNQLTIFYTLSVSVAGAVETYYTGSKAVLSGQRDYFDISSVLRESTKSTLKIYAVGPNHDITSTKTISITFVTSELRLQQPSDFSNTNTYNTGKVALSCEVIGTIDKILDIYFDGELIETRYLDSKAVSNQSLIFTDVKHGYHTVKVELYQSLGTSTDIKRGPAATPLSYEIAVVQPNDSAQPPIIWLGDYQDVYYNYDTILIPFLVYDPADTTKAKIHLYKNDIEIDSSPREIDIATTSDKFNYWEISDADLDKQNYYQISCGESEERKVTREISFIVQQDPKRADMKIAKQDNLILNFDPIGRSNSESLVRRSTWSYGENISANFENFNWYNNGWYTDTKTNQTCLRISNGAKFSIPMDPLVFASSNSSQQSNSIEIEFKIRNVQNYGNLISNVTRYNNDDKYYQEFLNQTIYTNYDSFLQDRLKEEIDISYDDLVFNRVDKIINLSNIVCGYYSGDQKGVVGFGIGPQDTFFSNGTDTVNVSFVEDEIINLSFVYSHSLKLLLIYINGCITGVIKSSRNDIFRINTDSIVFNSQYCDIDLYKLRIYNTELTVNDIVINYSVDKKNVKIFDQNKLAESNAVLKEYQIKYNNIVAYNEEHPNEPLMPYIILDTTVSNNNNKLPYRKDEGSNNIKMTFVNTPLEQMYLNGELESLARADGLIAEGEQDKEKIKEGIKKYYKHHCPSFTSSMSSSDTVTIQVQGTSSEFYPRRNFKVKSKYKKDNTWDETENEGEGGWTESSCLNIFMNRGPYADIYTNDQQKLQENPHYYGLEESRLADGWYLNNYTNPTDRWTLKIDYMESSGSYNAGFASMVGTAYSKHPLQDYYEAKDLLKNKNKINSDRWEDYRTSLLGFPVMAFQKISEENYIFIGYYRMLLDKSSTEVLGFKTDKKVTTNAVLDKKGESKKLRDVAECWEFSTNQRTFCSFRDPWNRVQLSFKAPKGEPNEFTAKYAPVVTDHFEYRYSFAEDFMDSDDYDGGLYNFSNITQSGLDNLINDINDETGWNIEPLSIMSPSLSGIISEDDKNKARAAGDITLRFYENWEKACQWLWSTCVENVISQGTYEKKPVGNKLYSANVYYIIDESNNNQFALCEEEEFDSEQTYYTLEEFKNSETGETTYAYVRAFVTSEDYLYMPNKFYQLVSGAYSLISNETFDSNLVYYQLINMTDEELATKADLLVEKAGGEFDNSNTYYTYNSSAKINPTGLSGAVQLVETPTLEEFNQGIYYVAAPKEYSKITYKYDTQEYRTAKFINEFSEHFDPEYVATYFVMTEVFECYDSRGKNCMMASWGPQKVGGNYIWYPIFYDIDTQLGINNTGIPSFEYNVDATEAYNFSTSDSILWNNFYKFFKNSYILTKYQHLRGSDQSIWKKKLSNPPLKDVDTIEGWYSFDPIITNNIAAKGDRPLIATNLDMYFKYITITNKQAIAQNVGYLDGQGSQTIDTNGTYFYALQGDRSQSRRQFITNRLEYIDSWLGQKNYARGGSNRIRGRISANDPTGDTLSDIWVESNEEPYWRDDGTKTHELDAEYWLNLTPVRSTYVTAGEDNANYPSQKYDGINPVRFELSQLENAIRTSPNYAEQLVYIYGLNQMADCGDLSRLYFREFYLEGEAPHLTSLRLGDDGKYGESDGSKYTWYNKSLNGITLPELPLLKEANFSKIGLSTEQVLNLEASEKLENFRAVGTSKLQSVKFAPGVALNTLYLPASVTELSLTQANLLNKVIEKAEAPMPKEDKTVEKGLFIEGFFSEPYGSSLNKINLKGGSLGYGSYSILDTFYNNRKDNNMNSNITMTDVIWTPYTQLVDGDIYLEGTQYYQDDGHYGFKEYVFNNISDFNDLVLNGKLYIKNKDEEKEINYNFIDMLENLAEKENFTDATGQTNPVISGVVYVNNIDKEIEESYIRNTLQPKYPELTFFFAKVKKAYSIEFLVENNDSGIYEYAPYKNGDNLPATQKISQDDYNVNNGIWFNNPFDLYNPVRTHYDFQGWSLNPNPTNSSEIITDVEDWKKLSINANQFDYTYYAIFTIHQYDIYFYDGDGTIIEQLKRDYGTIGLKAPEKIPYLDDKELDLTVTYSFVGYTDNTFTNKVVDLSKITVRNNTYYYPVFEEIEVYDNIHPEYFRMNGTTIELIKQVQGKITIPKEINNVTVEGLNSTFSASEGKGQYLTHVFFEKGNKIKEFGNNCFKSLPNGNNKLIYVEFPEKLQIIGEGCFYLCHHLNYSLKGINVINMAKNSEVATIGRQAFQQAFISAGKKITIRIGGALSKYDTNVFFNTGDEKYGIEEVIIGSSDKKSDLILDKTFVKVTSDAKEIGYNVTFYSNKYKDASEISPYFENHGEGSIVLL